MRALIICLMLGIIVSGCGRKAKLDVPPGGVEDPRVEREWKKD